MTDTLSVKEFIGAMLDDICSSVEQAREQHPQIAPKDSTAPTDKSLATHVDFDLAITVTETNSSGADSHKGFKIGIMKSEAGVGKEKSEDQEKSVSTVSRIKFSIPVYFQYDQAKHQEIRQRSKQSVAKMGNQGW